MAYFFDSSAIVKRYVQETGSAWMLQLTHVTARSRLYLATISGVEVISALTRQARYGGLAPSHLMATLAKFRQDFTRLFSRIDITDAVIQLAMQLAENHALRGYDAVQLAAALEVHHSRLAYGLPAPIFVSADVTLNAAAGAEGLAVDDPNAHP
jgi:predicted nucleic acid-binding protein